MVLCGSGGGGEGDVVAGGFELADVMVDSPGGISALVVEVVAEVVVGLAGACGGRKLRREALTRRNA